MAVERIVKSLITQGYKTKEARYSVEEGEVFRALYSTEQEYQKHVELRFIMPATEKEYIDYLNKSIPILSEDEIPEELRGPVMVSGTEEEVISESDTGKLQVDRDVEVIDTQVTEVDMNGEEILIPPDVPSEEEGIEEASVRRRRK